MAPDPIRFSIVIPTIGRDSLRDLISQLVPQLGIGDELVVVSDGPSPRARAIAERWPGWVRYHERGPTHRWGNSQRNHGVSVAKGTHLMFLDDDDRVNPGYIDVSRKVASEHPDRILMFRMSRKGGILWDLPRLKESHFSTQMFVIPNVKGKLGTWSERYAGDADFFMSTLAFYPEGEKAILFREEILTTYGESLSQDVFVKWPTISFIVPTIGRDSLLTLMQQILPQLWEGDEILVVGDGPQPLARAMVEGLSPFITYLEHGPSRCFGHAQRNFAMLVASGTHLMFLDDDDGLLPGALTAVREVVARAFEKIVLFRTRHRGDHLWVDKAVRHMNVTTQMYVIPNIPERYGTWGDRYEGDFDFLVSAVAAHPEKEGGIVWREEVITVHGEPAR